MKYPLSLILTGLFLGGCQSAAISEKPDAPAEAKSEWQASTLSEQTIAQANAAVRDYRQCLNDETLARANDQGDSRAIADAILRRCENQLTGIKTAFDAEKVPPSISERYMRKNRSQGAQGVLRYVMSVQAMRAADQESQKSKP